MGAIDKVLAIARELEQKGARASRLSWTQYTTGFDFGVVQAQEDATAVLRNEDHYRTVLEHRQRDLSPLDRRRVELSYQGFKQYHISEEFNRLESAVRAKRNALSQLLNAHRVRLGGREVRSTEIAQILRSSPDRALRKKAFLARTQVNRPLVEAGILDLIRLRKELAAVYGAQDFVAYQLEMAELSPRVFDGWEEQAARLRTRYQEVCAALGHTYLRDERVMPWDTAYLAARLAPQLDHPVDMSGFYEIIRDLFHAMGFDISKYNITYDIFPRRNKSEWGYNFTIERGRDSRVLANVEGRYQELGVLLHETGHAVHSFCLDPDDILLNMGVSGIVSEGLANLFGSLLYHRACYRRFFRGGLRRVEADFARLREYNRAGAFTAMAGILFDQQLYRCDLRSLDDVNQLYWDALRRITGERPYASEPAWGFRIHYTTHPIYLHNYFLGDLTNKMLKQVFCRRHGVDDVMEKPRAFGKFLRKAVMSPSGTWPFLELFERISGEPFSLRWLAP